MPTILIVEDNHLVVEMLTLLLHEEGYHVIAAQHGAEGLEQLAAHQVDLVLCDIMMPVLDGLSFCREMQANSNNHTIPLVFMSAAPEYTIQADCTFAAFLPKPLNIEMLIATVERLLSGNARMAE